MTYLEWSVVYGVDGGCADVRRLIGVVERHSRCPRDALISVVDRGLTRAQPFRTQTRKVRHQRDNAFDGREASNWKVEKGEYMEWSVKRKTKREEGDLAIPLSIDKATTKPRGEGVHGLCRCLDVFSFPSHGSFL